jgi:FkbM family methyltransferase
MLTLLMNESILVYSFFKLIKRKRGVLIDVGAHIGNFLKPFGDAGWRVYAFEPSEDNFKSLKKNYIDKENVICFKKAVSNKDGMVKFYISNKYWGINSLKAFDKSHNSYVEIMSIRLESFINKYKIDDIDFLKIDVEGADFLVLKGMNFDICKPKIVMCEFMDSRSTPYFKYDHHDMVNYMNKFGYTAYIFEWSKIVGGYSEKGVDKGITTSFVRYSKYPSRNKLYWGNVVFVKKHISWLFNLFTFCYLHKIKQNMS